MVALVIVLALSLLGGSSFLPSSIISISNVTIDPQGGTINQNGELTGAYWVVIMTADQINDNLDAIKFDNSTIPSDAKFQGQELKVKSTITIRVDPGQPYYTRQMELLPVEVCPNVYGTAQRKALPYDWIKLGTNIGGSVSSGHYEWASTPDGQQWKKTTPFTITVLKNGQQVGNTLNFNTDGGTNQVLVPTGEGNVIIRNLGMLAGQYSAPDYDQVVLFAQTNQMFEGVKAKQLMKSPFPAQPYQISSGKITTGLDTFAAYWFGTSVWDDGMPQAVQGSGYPYTITPSDAFGGWKWGDDSNFYRRLPVKPEIWDDSKLSTDKQKFGTVADFLDRNCQRIDLNIGAGRGSINTSTKLYKLPIPWNALSYGAPVFQVLIPTALADTFVYRPPVSNVKILSINQPSNTGEKLYTTYIGSITLKQESTVLSDTELSFQIPSGLPLTINPNPIQISLKPGETKTIPIYFLNPGNDVDGRQIQVTAVTRELFTGSTTDTKIFTVILGARTEQTVSLAVYTLEAGTGTPLDVQVTVKHNPADGTPTQQSYTIDGQHTFDLGTYQGQVIVTALPPATHNGATKTIDLNPGVNAVTLILTPIGQVGESFDWNWLIIVMVSALAVVIVYYYFIKRNRRG